ncbi:MAG: hydantoinase/oxoprolinase family protein [Candidatus Bathyarchaeia archaeon]
MGKVRVGIDVGGTFTKAVAIDCETLEIVGKYEVLTTHSAPEGVARGIVDAFYGLMKHCKIQPEDVVFIAHSTTQATNALLEGDVEPVGIVAMGKGFDGLRAKSATKVGNVELGPQRHLKTYHTFIDTNNGLSKEEASQAIKDLQEQGARVIVASEAFGVDNPENELAVVSAAIDRGLPAIGAHEISKLYGLKTRTRTACINASILPKMMETANMIEQSVRKAGITAPIMVMRGDGGVMAIDEMRKRPILTSLSGPAASVAGCLMYLRITDGIYFEVGGTSTNLGVIRKGRPMFKYVELGGHPTFLHSLDVRVVGVAGGSMPRVKDRKIIDVGPRSAHIAGLPYASFVDPKEIKDPELVFIQPKKGDPNDYVAIKTASGKLIAITNTCAANALGLTKPGDYAYGNRESARKAIEVLAKHIGLSIDETATQILTIATDKVIPVINDLIKEYKLEKEVTWLAGGGGGAAALVPFLSKRTGISYKISENAEVISSIGVALAVIQDMVERHVINPTPEVILSIKREAEMACIKSGAAPSTVEVFVEVDAQKKKVRALAWGALEFRTRDIRKTATLDEVKEEAAKSMHLQPSEVTIEASIDDFYVVTGTIKQKGVMKLFRGGTPQLRVVDKYGVVRLSIQGKTTIAKASVQDAEKTLKEIFAKNKSYTEAGAFIPSIYVLCEGRILDYSGLIEEEQVLGLLRSELAGRKPERPLIIIATSRQ